jgi:hypothetical protein
MNRLSSTTHPTSIRSQPVATEAPILRCGCLRHGATWALASLLSLACVLLIAACGGGGGPPHDGAAESSTASISPDVPVRASTDDPEWAPGETSTASVAPPPTAAAAAAPRKPISELWNADGRARITLPEDWPADTAAHWSGQRYATRTQLDHEMTTVAPYTLVIDADDEAALETALQYAEAVNTFAGGKDLLGVFVRSRQPALAARLAERLTAEQGWAHVFVVI